MLLNSSCICKTDNLSAQLCTYDMQKTTWRPRKQLLFDAVVILERVECITRDPSPYKVSHIQMKSTNLFHYLNLHLVVFRAGQTIGLAGGNTICKEQSWVPNPFGSGAGDYQRMKKQKTKKQKEV